jgi:hypothetical protein
LSRENRPAGEADVAFYTHADAQGKLVLCIVKLILIKLHCPKTDKTSAVDMSSCFCDRQTMDQTVGAAQELQARAETTETTTRTTLIAVVAVTMITPAMAVATETTAADMAAVVAMAATTAATAEETEAMVAEEETVAEVEDAAGEVAVAVDTAGVDVNTESDFFSYSFQLSFRTLLVLIFLPLKKHCI